MNKILLTGLILALAAAACDQVADRHDSLDEALSLITQEGIYAHLAHLSDDALEGRESGTPGYDKAAAYVAEQFAELGLGPGGNDGWYQQVPLVTYELDTESFELTIHRDGVDTPFKYREHFGGYANKVEPVTEVRGEVVYAGYGVHAPEHGYSDFDGIAVDSKVVAFFDNAPSSLPSDERAYYASTRTKQRELASRGAVATIRLRTQKSVESTPWERLQKVMGLKADKTWVDESGAAADYHPELRGRIYLSVATATGLFADAPISFEEARAASESNMPASTALGFEATIKTVTHHEQVDSPNVIGMVRGTDPQLADEYVVFTAHLDHTGIGVPIEGSDDAINNGAYDNALGVALMLEAARAIASTPPRRSVMFIALTAEESGLLGSDYFAHYPTVPIESIVANVNLDMPLFIFPVAELVGFGAEHSSLQEPMSAAAEAEGFVLAPDPLPEENLFVRSDQYSFVRQGIPASYLDTGFGSTDPDVDGEKMFRDYYKTHYHKPSDDLTRPVDWDSAMRFSRANARIGFDVANADERPTWNEGDFFGEMFAR